ncbi:hypothetical protein NB037_04805 [Rathayibacter sp. ZW T2_19]|uniref:Uncharacterized protein n=1 Tax=Rathayibacter rubneri TaxID=2950106 RepID=A0A9X2DZR4_9MICO|nr:hypothetical protein [Rathayibacter rubneri]MCM6761734.1 hypothetical protein [Rathayibacter rubneri]
MPQTDLAQDVLTLFLDFVARDIGPDARTPEIVAAWVDGPAHVAVIYRSSFQPGLVLRLRRFFDADLRIDARFGAVEIQESISEPLGDGVDFVRADGNGVLWLGDLDEELPEAPSRR